MQALRVRLGQKAVSHCLTCAAVSLIPMTGGAALLDRRHTAELHSKPNTLQLVMQAHPTACTQHAILPGPPYTPACARKLNTQRPTLAAVGSRAH